MSFHRQGLLRRVVAAAALAAAACAHEAAAPTAEAPPTGAPVRTSEVDEGRQAQALYDRGEAALARAELAKAQGAFSDLAARFPLDPHADLAKRRLAEIEVRLKRFGEAERNLKDLYERTPPAERPRAARALAAAAEGAGDGAEAIRDWCEVVKLDPTARGEAAGALERLAATSISADGAARLAGDLPQDCPAQDPLAFRRALVLAHLGEAQAQGALEDALRRFPDSRAAPQARATLERLAARLTAKVQPGLVGLLVPESPESVSAYGKAAIEGLKLALGDTASLIVKDTKGDPAVAAAAVRELAAQGVQVIVGPILSGESEAAAVAAEDVGIPIVTLTRAEGITRVGPYVFRNMLTDSAQARALAHYAFDIRGFQRFAVLYPEVEYGEQMMSLFWDAVAQKGGRFRGAEAYPFDSTTFKGSAERLVGRADLEMRRDWREGVNQLGQRKLSPLQKKRALRQLRESLAPIVDFDAIFVADSAHNVALVAPALAVENVVTNGCDEAEMRRMKRTTGEAPRTVELLGWTAWADPDFDLVQRAGHYVQCSVFVDGFFEGSARPETRAFVAAFAKAYGHPPGLLEAEAYDTGAVLQKALEGHPATRQALRDALAAVRHVRGATGDTSISSDREAEKELFFVTITDKGYEELDLSKLAAAKGQPGG